MYKVEGSKGKVANGLVEMKDNPFGHGASGGAWIGELTIPHVGVNYAIGLNSHSNHGDNSLYSPYFDATTFNLFKRVESGCRD